MKKEHLSSTSQNAIVPWYLSFAFITIIIIVGCITVAFGIGIPILIVGIILIVKRRKLDKSLREIANNEVLSTPLKKDDIKNIKPCSNSINHIPLSTDNTLTDKDLIILDFLKKVKGRSPNEIYKIFYFRSKSFVDKWYNFCINENLIALSSGYAVLPFCTVDELKYILKEHSLKVSGKKAELIERIKENIIESDLHLNSSIVLTGKGMEIYNNFENKSKEELQETFNNAVNLMFENKYIDAYNIIYLYKQKQVYNSSEYKAPSDDDISTYNMIYNRYSDKQIPAIFEVLSLLGLLYENSKKIIMEYDSSIDYEAIFYEFDKIQTIIKMESYKESDFSMYEISTVDDLDVCDMCAKLQHKTFYVNDYKIGVNAPPFHKGCRCTVFPYLD